MFCAGKAFSQQVSIKLSNLNNDNGLIRVAAYSTEDNYDNEVTNLKFSFEKSEIKNGTIVLNLDPGKYVIAVLDDKNRDAEMNYNLIGIPKEGYGFSNLPSASLLKPSYKEAAIQVVRDKDLQLKISMRYL